MYSSWSLSKKEENVEGWYREGRGDRQWGRDNPREGERYVEERAASGVSVGGDGRLGVGEG